MRKLLLCALLFLCFPFSLNAAQETLSNVVGDCIVDPDNEIGCSDPGGVIGNPNDLVECYYNATLTPPFELTAFTYTIGTSVPPPDSLNLKVFEWSGPGAPGSLITTVALGAGDLTPGFHNLVLASPVALPTPDFCVGLNSDPADDGFRAATTVEFSGYTAGTSWVKAPDCGIIDFTEMINIGFEENWCFSATINQLIFELDIDLKPGSNPNCVNLEHGGGRTAVAIYSSADFDATMVDPVTVLFDGASPLRWAVEDANSDGLLDLVFHFKKRELASWDNAPENCREVVLTAELFDGTPVIGSDILCTPGGVNCEGGIPTP